MNIKKWFLFGVGIAIIEFAIIAILGLIVGSTIATYTNNLGELAIIGGNRGCFRNIYVGNYGSGDGHDKFIV